MTVRCFQVFVTTKKETDWAGWAKMKQKISKIPDDDIYR